MSLAEIRRNANLPLIGPPGRRFVFAAVTVCLTLAIVASVVLSVPVWSAGAQIAMPLIVMTALWISGGAATALVGLFTPAIRSAAVPEGWSPAAPTALLVTLCGENPADLARHLAALRGQLDRAKLADTTRIFVLSDTSGETGIAAEEAAFRALVQHGMINYRRRAANIGRKPGNIAEWLNVHGCDFAYMMVLDADSRMTADRIRRMIWQMERRPNLGLLQAGIALVPAATRFGQSQRVAARLLSRTFGRGFAAWSDQDGNYWGHNAIMRTEAFRVAARLPHLSGTAPFGGELLSHDFIEAAWIRRAGWSVVLDPESLGSAESAPQTLAAFHRRDRRWCQGNLQHLRLLGTPGLSAISRVHLAAGVLSYLVAPAWLAIVALFASGAVQVNSIWPLLLVVVVLALPKLCALADWLGRTRAPWRRKVVLRAWAAEIAVSSLVAPIVMVRQAGAVALVCLGRDCGWKTGRTIRTSLPRGLPEAAAGGGILALCWLASGAAMVWLAPVVVPLCAAPMIIRILDAPA